MLLLVALLLPFLVSGFRLFQFTQVCVYAMVLLGLNLLTGSLHWVIQVIHLLLGLGLLGLADTLATRAKARLAPVA